MISGVPATDLVDCCLAPYELPNRIDTRAFSVIKSRFKIRLNEEDIMEAVIQTGSKQYTVKKGTILEVEKLDAEVGSAIELDVLSILGDTPKFGQPLVEGAKVVAKVVAQKRAPKIVVSTYKRRTGYHLKQGHRQDLTSIEVTEIKA